MAARRKRVAVRNYGKQERSKETFSIVVEAAIRVLERDPSTFNTNSVALAAGISVGTLYQYFPNKQSIMAEVIRRELDRDRLLFERKLVVGAATSREEAVERVIDVAMEINERHPNLQRAMFDWLGQAEQVAYIREIHLANVKRVGEFFRGTKDFPSDTDAHFFSLLCLSLAANVFQLLTNHGGASPAEIRHHLRRLMLGYLAQG